MNKLIIILIVIGCGFSILSKPTDEVLEKQIFSQILSEVKSPKTDANNGIVDSFINFSCNLFPNKCAQQIYDTSVTIEIEDNILFKTANVKIGDKNQSCIGIINTWKC
ncbi:MAG: hypothetical protein Q9M50_03615 [Methylococcales bacterium]|nr:hypothetical protein [Methylococcales bacterium]